MLLAILFAFFCVGFAGPITDASIQRQILDKHNSERARWGSAPLTWDDGLANSAFFPQIRSCVMEHSSGSGNGENLAMGVSEASAAVDMWISEKSKYRCGTFPDVSITGSWFHVGHFTQVIAPRSSRVGCASQQCGGRLLVACQYNPGGNMQGSAFPCGGGSPVSQGSGQSTGMSTGTQTSGSQTTGRTQTSGSQTSGSQTSGSQTSGSQTSGSQTTGRTQTSGSQTTGRTQTSGSQTTGRSQTSGGSCQDRRPLNFSFNRSPLECPEAARFCNKIDYVTRNCPKSCGRCTNAAYGVETVDEEDDQEDNNQEDNNQEDNNQEDQDQEDQDQEDDQPEDESQEGEKTGEGVDAAVDTSTTQEQDSSAVGSSGVPGWGIALLVLGCIIVLLLLAVVVLAIRK